MFFSGSVAPKCSKKNDRAHLVGQGLNSVRCTLRSVLVLCLDDKDLGLLISF